ncbi:MAG TPA: hypothetical protein VGQ90_08915 [Stellaceae bacterium]|nr:hypothetical protein [Stellaceae bacterium]
MPSSDDGKRSRPGRFGSALILTALSLLIGACAPINESAPPGAANSPIAAEPLPGPIALAPSITGAPAASSTPRRSAPAVATQTPSPEPIEAAATPALPPTPTATVAAPAASPKPVPAVATPATPATAVAAPAPTASVEDSVPIPTGPLPQCPPGTIAMWSKPDIIGTRVGICHTPRPPK